MRSEHNLTLTEEEAVGLLHIVMMAPMELSAEQLAATEKLSHCCRNLIVQSNAANGDANSKITIHGHPPTPALFPVPR
jgi:hypothetical protein